MCAHHGQERKQGGGSQHREHIAEVGRRRHLDIFVHIGIGLAAFDNAFFQNHQVFFQKNNVCRFLRDIDCVIHRNANVGGLHCRSVIDTITHEANGMAVIAKDSDDAGLLSRRELCKYVSMLRRFCQSVVVHLVNIGAQQQVVDLQAYPFADKAGYLVVVASQNFGCNAILLEGFDCFMYRFLRRV